MLQKSFRSARCGGGSQLVSTVDSGGSDPVSSLRLPFGGTWNGLVGIQGGIPTSYTQSGATVTLGGVAATNRTNIQNAINAAVANTYVQLPAGTYDISDSLLLNKAGVEIRGAVDANNIPTTILNFLAINDDAAILVNSGTGWDISATGMPSFTRIVVNSGGTRGSTTVALTSTPTTLSVDDLMFITATSGSTALETSIYDFGGSADSPYFQIVRVTAKVGNNVSFTPAIDADYLTGTIRVNYRNTASWIRRSGIRDLKLTQTIGGNDDFVKFIGTDECWEKNVWSDFVYNTGSGCGGDPLGCNPGHMHFVSYVDYRTQIDHCDFGRSQQTGPGNYLIFLQGSTNAFIVNNHLHTMPQTIPILASHGTAIAYNYCHDFPYIVAGWMSQGIYGHGGHTKYILLEGNRFGSCYNDTSSAGTHVNYTLLRNRIPGYDSDSSTGVTTSNGTPLSIEAGHRGFTAAGNVLGQDGYQGTIDGSGTPSGGDLSGGNFIYQIDTSVTSTQKFANYNTVTDGIPASETLAVGQAIVNSYLYTSKPSWYPSSLVWPPVDPANFTQSNTVNNLPAGYRANHSGVEAA